MGPLSIGGRGTTISRAAAVDSIDGVVGSGRGGTTISGPGAVDSIDGVGGSACGGSAVATGAATEGTGCALTSVIVSGGGSFPHCAQPDTTRTPRTVIIQSKSLIGTGENFTAPAVLPVAVPTAWCHGRVPSVAHVVGLIVADVLISVVLDLDQLVLFGMNHDLFTALLVLESDLIEVRRAGIFRVKSVSAGR